MIGNERFHQYAIALDSFPMIALIISELNFGIKAHQETMAKLENIVLYPNYEDAKLDLLRIYTRHK